MRLTRLVPLAALASFTAAGSGAQEAPAVTCGPSISRAPTATAPEIDSVMRARSSAELERLTATMRSHGVVGGGRVQLGSARGWLGLTSSELSEMKVTAEGRVVRYCDYPVVVKVEPASPAAKAGVQAGDTIVSYNGADLRKAGEVALDKLLTPGDTVRVGLRRDGRALTLPLVVGRTPERAFAGGGPGFSYVIVTNGDGEAQGRVLLPAAPQAPNGMSAPVAVAGVAMSPESRVRVQRRGTELAATTARSMLPPMLMAFPLGGSSALAGAQLVTINKGLSEVLRAKQGLLVVNVGDGSPADESGLRSGDVIVRADGREVASSSDLQMAFARREQERALSLRVERNGKSRDVVLKW